MNENARTSRIIERFSSFVEQKKAGKKAGSEEAEAFKKRLSEMSSSSKEEGIVAKRRGSRRHQPPKITELTERAASPQKRHTQKFARSRNLSMTHAQRLAKFAPLIESAARRHKVPVELICGVILQESGGNPRAKSHCGARGLMQLMPATARRFGVNNSYNPAQNIEGGTKYLRWLLDRFDGKVELALAGYNAGEGAVEKYGNKIPPYKETQNYVPAVLSYTQSIIEVFSIKLASNMPDYARKV
ncbi:MAG: lytic transglycosylase domain-containing protein [Pseudomonadota bacterium]